MKIQIKNFQLNINRRQIIMLIVNMLFVIAFFVLGHVADNSKERF